MVPSDENTQAPPAADTPDEPRLNLGDSAQEQTTGPIPSDESGFVPPPVPEPTPDDVARKSEQAALADAESGYAAAKAAAIVQGHALIEAHMQQARRVADVHPALKAMLPVMSACFHDLFNFMVTGPSPAPDKTAPPAG